MKKIISILIATIIMIFNVGCMFKTYSVGDTQTMKGVDLTVTKIDGGKYYGSEESRNGEWVCVYFTMKNLNSEPFRISYLYFTLNDTYTVRETTYRLTNIESGGFYLIQGTVYEFWCIYDCSYGYNEKDLKFIWETNGLFGGGTREWVL